jgi:hypothetical protein
MTVLRNLALTGVAFGGSWSGAIWYWRETNRMPATSELALYMLVLPLALLAAWWLGRKAWARVSMPAAAGSGAAAGAASAAPDTSTPPPLAPALSIAATALRAPHGDSVDELRAALAGNRARPGLDRELYDDDGYPIMSARLPNTDDAPLRDELNEWRTLHRLGDPRFDAGQWRALAAASAVAGELAAQACTHQLLAPWQDQQQKRQQGLLPPDALPAAAPPILQLLTMWPVEWKPEQRHLAQQWLRYLATQAGWPQQLLAPEAQDGDDAGQVLAALLARCGDARHPCLAIVIAAGSHLSEDGVNRLSNQNALFTSAHPQGLIPGEGAAGLLLADAASAPIGGNIGGSLLQAIGTGARDGAADQSRRQTRYRRHACAEHHRRNSCTTGQADCRLTASQLLAADTGHRTSRVTELMHGRWPRTATPHLDHRRRREIGIGTASCGQLRRRHPRSPRSCRGRTHDVRRTRAAAFCASATEDPHSPLAPRCSARPLAA